MKYGWKWTLDALESVKKNGCKVFSCFSCGGGSTMGYKLAGYDVIGNCEIDAAMNLLYTANHHPEYNFQMDIRQFRQIPDSDLPEELFHLDILDGSPPCSTFSISGDREKNWGKKKAFREGQAAQVLDDLFFEFIKTAAKLRPRVVIAENVKGLLVGNARGYVNAILRELKLAGYETQIFLLNAAFMGVPQRRERVFFLSHRKELPYPKLSLSFSERPVLYGEIKSRDAPSISQGSKTLWYWKQRIATDKCLGDISRRILGRTKGFNNMLLHDNEIAPTLTSNGTPYRFAEPVKVSEPDFIHMQTFPEDYNFMKQSVQYVCGMSVPPVMMAHIADEVWRQWLSI